MRKITSLVAALIMSVATFAQAPQGFSYQAVVRDAQNAIVANQTVDVDITITAEIDSVAVQTYKEKHSVTTNANGLFTLVVGNGESDQKLSEIKWNMPNAVYKMRTETAYGTAVTQLLSVPFALYAEQAGEIDYQKLLNTLSSDEVKAFLNYVSADDLQNYVKADVLNQFVLKTNLTNNYLTKETFENYIISGGNPDSVDLTVYAKTADVNAAFNFSNHYNDSVFARKSDIPLAVDLSGYVKSDTLGIYALRSDLGNFATWRFVDDTLNYFRSVVAMKEDVAKNYVTKEAFDNYVLSGGQAESVDLTVYAKTADVENTYAKKSDIPSLSGYALKSDIPTMPNVPTKVSELQNDANYLTSHQDITGKQDVITDLADIRSGAALGATALQSHQDISGKQDVITDLETIRSGAALGATALQSHQSLDAYAKTADMNTALAGKADTADVQSLKKTVKATSEIFGNEVGLANSDVVDLGLESGNLWATCNIGANSPSDDGGYYAWGETTTKEVYTWETYQYGDSETALTKYCLQANNGSESTDELTILEVGDDAAAANLGNGWVMPTITEWEELYNQCFWVETSDYNGTGVAGYIVYKSVDKSLDKQLTKGSNHTYTLTTDAHIFLPISGRISSNNVFQGKEIGWYWSSTLTYPSMYGNASARGIRLYKNDGIYTDLSFGGSRCEGWTIRPIRRADASVLSKYVTLTQLQQQIAALQEQLAQLQSLIPTNLGGLDHTADLTVTVNYVINNDYPAEYNTPEDAWVYINDEKVTSTKTFSNISTSEDLKIMGKLGNKSIPAGWSYHGYYEIFINGEKWEKLNKIYWGITRNIGSESNMNNVYYMPAYTTSISDADKADYKVELIGKPTSSFSFNPNHYDYSFNTITIPHEDLYKTGNCQIVINMYVTAYKTN